MRILLAKEHDLCGGVLSAFIENEGPAQVEIASSLDEALEVANDDRDFDLIILDFNAPGMDGLQGLSQALERSHGVPVAVLSSHVTKSIAAEAVEKGAQGFLPKSLSAKDVVGALRAMISGIVFLPMSHIQTQHDNNPVASLLSRRELQVLSGLCRGQSNKEIARELDLQEVTVKLHVRTLCRKLDAKNRTHAAMLAKEANLF